MTIPKALVALACSVLLAAAASAAPGSLFIKTGESIVVRVGADGAMSVESRAAAPTLSGFEQSALAQMQAALAQVPPDAKTLPAMPILGPKDTKVPDIRPNSVRLTFRAVAGGSEAMLWIENGYDGAFRYRAVMHRGERSAPTDVCQVMPKKPGAEHWPFQIERLELSEARLEPWQDGQGIRCQ
jgi:ABC-type amino acid transport substrate-binding protein